MRALSWIVLAASLVGAGSLLGAMKDPADPVQQSYLSVPPEPMARMVGGFYNLAADLYYIRFASYWGYQLTHGRHLRNLKPILDVITDLDPRFKAAYEVGAIALGDAGKPYEAEALLDKGAKVDPSDYWFPYQTGLTLFFFSSDFMKAAHYFELAASKPNAPPEAGYFAARMYEKSTRQDLEIETWRRIYARTNDPSVRQVAKNALKKLGIEIQPS